PQIEPRSIVGPQCCVAECGRPNIDREPRMTEELFRADGYKPSCEAKIVTVRPDGIVLDRTVFYYESGGQPGDSGRLTRADGTVIGIADTKRDKATGAILHVPQEDASAL